MLNISSYFYNYGCDITNIFRNNLKMNTFFLKKMNSSYDATICFYFCIYKKLGNGIGLTILGLITSVLPYHFLGKNLKSRGIK